LYKRQKRNDNCRLTISVLNESDVIVWRAVPRRI